MRRPSTGQPAERTSKAPSAAIDTHIRAVEAAAGKLTPEQADRLRALLPAPANMVRRTKDVHLALARVVVTLVVLGLTGFIVADLSRANPTAIAAALVAFAAVLAAIPAIVKALR